MTFVPARAGQYQSAVSDNVQLNERYFLLRVSRPDDFPDPAPGQFVHLAVPDTGRFFLRRPFSVFDCTKESLDILILERGAGTQAIRRLRKGEHVDFYGPLGNWFPPAQGKKILAVAGGVGLAPLYFYGFKGQGTLGPDYRLAYGAQTRDDLFLDHFDLAAAGAMLSTDDGSYGFEGNVVELAKRELQQSPADVIYSCGPTAMLKAADRLASGAGIKHFVSLENRMGCGVGACRACVVPTRLDGGSPYRTVCHDGPVFDAADLVWGELPTP